MSRVLGGSWGGGRFLMGEVPLQGLGLFCTGGAGQRSEGSGVSTIDRAAVPASVSLCVCVCE